MSKMLHEVAYCKDMSNKMYANGDFVSGRYYEDEAIDLIDWAYRNSLITNEQVLRLRHYGRL